VNFVEDLLFVLKTTRIKDRDVMIQALSRDNGLLNLRANNAISSSRYSGGLKNLALYRVKYREKEGAEIFYLDSAILEKEFEKIPIDFEKFQLSQFFCEIIFKVVVSEQPAKEIFNLFYYTLSSLEKIDVNHQMVLASSFLIKFLHWYGANPMVSICSVCKQELVLKEGLQSIYLTPVKGGVTCGECVTDQSGQFDFKNYMLFQKAISVPIEKFVMMVIALNPNQEEITELFKYLIEFMGFQVDGLSKDRFQSLSLLFKG